MFTDSQSKIGGCSIQNLLKTRSFIFPTLRIWTVLKMPTLDVWYLMCYWSVYSMNKPSGISVVHYGWKSFTWSHFLLRLTLLSAGSVPAGKTTRVSSGTAAAALTLRGWASTWASPAGSCMVSVTPVWRQWCSSSPQSASSVQVWHTVYIITNSVGSDLLYSMWC